MKKLFKPELVELIHFEKEIFDYIKENFFTLCKDEIITEELICKYKNIFAKNDIFCNEYAGSGYLLITEGERHIYGETTIVVKNNAKVKGYYDLQILALDNSEIICYDDCKVWAYNNSKVEALDKSIVEAHDSSKIVSLDECRVYLYDNSTAIADGNSEVWTEDKKRVEVHNNAFVQIHDYILN